MPYPYYNYSYAPSILWVHETEVPSYPVAPNSSVLLMDRDKKQFYIKTADASGMPMPVRTFTYTETHENALQATKAEAAPEYVTREEFEQRLKEMACKSAKSEVEA